MPVLASGVFGGWGRESSTHPLTLAGINTRAPQASGGYARAFYGVGNRQHRAHRKTAAQRYHRGSK